MTESPATSDAIARPPLDNFYRWDELDIGVTVYLDPEMLDRLQVEALQIIDGKARRGNEAGGVLLGSAEIDKGRIRIVVEDFAAIPRLDGEEVFYTPNADLFARALAKDGAAARRRVVGYYRSHNRSGLFLSPADLSLIRRQFPEPESLVVIVKTLPSRACTAGFFFWKDGEIQGEFTNSEVPLLPISFEPAGPMTAGVTDEVGDSAPVEMPAAIPPPVAAGRNRRLMGGLVLAGIATAAAVAVVHYRAPRAAAESGTRNPAVVSRVEPSESTASRPQAGSTFQPAHAAPTGEKARRAPVEAATAVAREPERPALRPFRQLSLPSAPAAAPASTAALPVAPGVDELPAANNPGLPPVQMSLPARPVAPPPVAPAAEPAATPAPARPGPLKTRTYAGPQVIHEVAPAVPREVRSRLSAGVQVNVEVTIDAGGRVTGARVVSTKGAAAGLLTIEALKAAQLFRFQPAQENGQGVSSAMVLTFRFEPHSQITKE